MQTRFEKFQVIMEDFHPKIKRDSDRYTEVWQEFKNRTERIHFIQIGKFLIKSRRPIKNKKLLKQKLMKPQIISCVGNNPRCLKKFISTGEKLCMFCRK